MYVRVGGESVGFLFCCLALGVLSGSVTILLKKRELVTFFNCVVAVSVLCLFLRVPWVGL